MIALDPERASLVRKVAAHLRDEERVDAARLVLEFSGMPPKGVNSDQEALEPLFALLHWLLDNDRYEEAAELLWGHRLFSPRPRCTQMVWKALREANQILLIGASSMSKTYASGVFFFLDWLRDPDYTTVKVIGPSEQHLSDNLFSQLVSLHRESALPLPGLIGDLYIGMDLRQRRSSIAGTVMPLGRKKAGKIQGVKRFPRKVPHPVFGRMSRLRILLDEIERVPMGVWQDLANVTSNLGDDRLHSLRVVGAYNPSDLAAPVAQYAEPPDGWDSIDPEKTETWISKRGWSVVRLDAHKSENVIEKREIFPGLQTKQGLDELAKNSGGTDSPFYWTFGRGLYPPRGTSYGIITPTILLAAKGRFIWYEAPRMAAGIDLALEGGDTPTVALGLWGVATGVNVPPSQSYPNGRKVMFNKPRVALQLDRVFSLDPGDTIAMARNIRAMGVTLSINPGWIMMDRTGNGAGVHDLVKDIWSPEVRGVNYSESATQQKIMQEDQDVPYLEYDRIYSELIFATRKWMEFGILKLSPELDLEKLSTQMTTRLYKATGKKKRAEAKPDYVSRGFKSPDEMDAVTLLVHGVRVASEVVPSMLGPSKEEADSYMAAEDSIYDVIVGPTDRFRDLDNDTSPTEEGFGYEYETQLD